MFLFSFSILFNLQMKIDDKMKIKKNTKKTTFTYLKITDPDRSYGASQTKLTAFFNFESVCVTAEHSFNNCIPLPTINWPIGWWVSPSNAWTINPLNVAPRSRWIISTKKRNYNNNS